MPPKKSSVAASKASTATPQYWSSNPRGRTPRKPFKSAEFIDDEAEEVNDESDDMKSMRSVSGARSRSRPRSRSVSSRARAADSSSDDDAMSVKSTTSSFHPRPVGKSKPLQATADNDVKDDKRVKGIRSNKSVDNRGRSRPTPKSKANIDDDFVDISSDDDAMSIKSNKSTNVRGRSVSKSTPARAKADDDWASSGDDAMSIKSAKSVKSVMSVDDDEWAATPPRRSRSVVPKTPVSSRTSSISKKRSASYMVSPITDEESFEMLPSPTKAVRFQKDAPLKGVLKKPELKPEVVIPIKSQPSRMYDGWDDEDVFANASTPDWPSSAKTASLSKITDNIGEDALQSPFEFDEFDEDADKTPKRGSSRATSRNKGKAASRSPAYKEGDVFLEDFTTSVASPDVDETDIGNRDPMLKSTYKGLPKLRAACVRSWSSKPAMLPSYSSLLQELSRLNTRLMREAILFSASGVFRNLSRSDPKDISTGVGSQTHFHPVNGGSPFTFVSTVKVGECHLVSPIINSRIGKMHKMIEGAPIEGEWERLVAVIGHVIDKTEYKAQLQAGYISFATAFATGDSAASSSYGARRPSAPNPFTRGPSSGNVALSCHEIVPIYDARSDDDTSFYECLLRVDQLPRITRELPPGSCAVVAYTVNTWGAGLPINVSFNVKWVMLLGAPGGKGRA